MMKKLLRSKYKEIRRSIIDKEDRDNIIFNRVINNTKVIDADTLLIYVSNEEEVDTINIIKYFINKKKIGVPRIDNGIMNFYSINSLDELMEGYFGILEPTSNNKIEDFNNTVSITPGICFSYDLYRIGYGKGFYDKFYSNHNVYKIGLCYTECLIDKIDNDKYDIKVDEIITDNVKKVL